MPNREYKRNRASGGRLENVSGALLVRRFSVRQPEIFRVIETVSEKKLTSMNSEALCELAQTVMDIEFEGLEGDFFQADFGLGAAIVVAHAKRRSRSFTVHDPFGAGPDAEKKAWRQLQAHGADERLNVRLVPGAYAETLVLDGALAFVHLNCSQYEPMRLLLERLAPCLVPGGRLVVDKYRSREDCKRAVDDYFHGKEGFQFARKSLLYVVKS